MSKKEESASESLAAFVIGFINIILKSLVLVKLWEWFIVYYFHVPPLTVPLALGIVAIMSLLTYQYTEDKRPFLEQVLGSLFFIVISLGFGFVYHLFL